MQTFEKTILKLHARKLISHIKIVEFIWINPPTETSVQKGVLADTDIKMVFSKNDPFYFNKEKNYLKVAMYAWDGNAFPGNEYWNGLLDASGDPAAASCSQIPQLQNPYINTHNIRASNVHIASLEFGGVLHISEYTQKKLGNQSTQTKIEL